MGEITWSVHHNVIALDMPGLGTNKNFWYITHHELSRYVSLELEKNNKCWPVGKLWSRDRCIPMGGSFSAQHADLHSIWGSYRGIQEFRCLGALNLSSEGNVLWTGRWKIALCQSRDNILMASDADQADCKEVVALVKSVLEPVECCCVDNRGLCQGRCMGPVICCMGFCIAMGGGSRGIDHAQPAALKDDWSLRLGPSLMSPKHAYKGYLGGIFKGALANGRPWVSTRAGQILSPLAWLQTALLSGHSQGDSMRAMHRALHGAFAAEPHFLPATLKAVYTASRSLPSLKCVAIRNLQVWLKQWAHWEGGRYTAWAPRGCADLRAYEAGWNSDWEALDRLR